MGSCCSSSKAVEVIGCQTDQLPLEKPTTSASSDTQAGGTEQCSTGTSPESVAESAGGTAGGSGSPKHSSSSTGKESRDSGVGTTSEQGSSASDTGSYGSAGHSPGAKREGHGRGGHGDVGDGGGGRTYRAGDTSGGGVGGGGRGGGSYGTGGGERVGGSYHTSGDYNGGHPDSADSRSRRSRNRNRAGAGAGDSSHNGSSNYADSHQQDHGRTIPRGRAENRTTPSTRDTSGRESSAPRILNRPTVDSPVEPGNRSAGSRRGSFSRHLPESDLTPSVSSVSLTRSKSLGRTSSLPPINSARSSSQDRYGDRMPRGGVNVGGGATAFYRANPRTGTHFDDQPSSGSQPGTANGQDGVQFGLQGQSALLHDRFGRSDPKEGTATGRDPQASSRSTPQSTRSSAQSSSSRGNARGRAQNRQSRKYDGFFLPLDTLTTPEETKPKKKKKKRNVPKGAAFTIGADGLMQEIERQDQSSSGDETESDEELSTTTPRIPTRTSYNLSEHENTLDSSVLAQYARDSGNNQGGTMGDYNGRSGNNHGGTMGDYNGRSGNNHGGTMGDYNSRSGNNHGGTVGDYNGRQGGSFTGSNSNVNGGQNGPSSQARSASIGGSQSAANNGGGGSVADAVRARWQQFDDQTKRTDPASNPSASGQGQVQGQRDPNARNQGQSPHDPNARNQGRRDPNTSAQRATPPSTATVAPRMREAGTSSNDGRKAGARQSRIPRSSQNTQVEVDALQQHIQDLRQLLAMHMARRGKDRASQQQTHQHTQLVKNFQADIVALENRLAEKEDELDRQRKMVDELKNNQQKPTTQGTTAETGFGTNTDSVTTSEMETQYERAEQQSQQTETETGTGTDMSTSPEVETIERAISSLDREFAEHLRQAKEDQSDAAIRELLAKHYEEREKLKSKLDSAQKKHNEKLQQKLLNRKRNAANGGTENNGGDISNDSNGQMKGSISGQGGSNDGDGGSNSGVGGSNTGRGGSNTGRGGSNDGDGGSNGGNNQNRSGTCTKDEDLLSITSSDMKTDGADEGNGRGDSGGKNRSGTFTQDDGSNSSSGDKGDKNGDTENKNGDNKATNGESGNANGDNGNENGDNDKSNGNNDNSNGDNGSQNGDAENVNGRPRRGTFTKDDNSDSDENNKDKDPNKRNGSGGSLNEETKKENGESLTREGTFTKDQHRSALSPLGEEDEEEDEERRRKAEEADTLGDTQIFGSMGTGKAMSVGTETAAKNVVDAFTQQCQELDDQFARDVWERRGDMTAAELNALMSQHYDEIETLRRARNSDLHKQHDAMMQKLQKRLKQRPRKSGGGGGGEGGGKEEDPEVKELMQELERASSRNAMSCGSDSPINQKETQTPYWREERMPVSKEELERLLREHREDRKNLLEMEAKNTLTHAQKIKQKLAQKLLSRGGSAGSRGSGGSGGTELKSEGEGDKNPDSSSPDPTPASAPAPQESSRQRRRRQKEEDSTERDAAEVIKEHKAKVDLLRQKKEEKEREHNEKLKRRLEKKLRKKNVEEQDENAV